jgi:hypothetical protein
MASATIHQLNGPCMARLGHSFDFKIMPIGLSSDNLASGRVLTTVEHLLQRGILRIPELLGLLREPMSAVARASLGGPWIIQVQLTCDRQRPTSLGGPDHAAPPGFARLAKAPSGQRTRGSPAL